MSEWTLDTHSADVCFADVESVDHCIGDIVKGGPKMTLTMS